MSLSEASPSHPAVYFFASRKTGGFAFFWVYSSPARASLIATFGSHSLYPGLMPFAPHSQSLPSQRENAMCTTTNFRRRVQQVGRRYIDGRIRCAHARPCQSDSCYETRSAKHYVFATYFSCPRSAHSARSAVLQFFAIPDPNSFPIALSAHSTLHCQSNMA